MGKQTASTNYHIPVLFNETINALHIQPDGIYVDCTFGGGGHSRGILNQLSAKGRLIAFDQDADAQHNLIDDERFLFIPQNFRHLQRFLRVHNITKIDGLLADLGVSSHQFDVGERGFSIRFEGPLDMRMDTRQPLTAAHVVATYTEQQLHKIFEQYGEVTNSKTLAKHLVEQRKHQPINTIEQFKSVLFPIVKGNPNKYWAQVFQALRIEVNGELQALEALLLQLPAVMHDGGIAAIITFHSLEDRIVKQYFKTGSTAAEEIDDNPFSTTPKTKHWELLNKKPIIATTEEQQQNPRSRSAKLRAARKLNIQNS